MLVVTERRCSNCGYEHVPYFTDTGEQKPYDDLICPKCGRHPSVTQF